MANALYLDAALLVGGMVVFYKLGAIGRTGLIVTTIRLALAAGAAGLIAYGIGRWLQEMTIVALAVGGLAGGLFYFTVLYIFRMRELVWLGTLLESSRFGKPMRWLFKPLLAHKGAEYGH